MIGVDRGVEASGWRSEGLNFCKFIVGTGTCIVLSSTITDVVKIIKGDTTIDYTDEDSEG